VETAFILVVAGLTTLAAGLAGRGGPHRSLRSAVGKTLESVGLMIAFLLGNLAVGFVLALVARAAGGGFVSLYVNDDVSIVILSVLQALVFKWWREKENSEAG
jgi:hypothetical protein